MFRTHSFSCSSCSATTVASSSFASFPRPSNPTSSSSLSSSSSSSVFAKRAFCLFAAVSTFIISSSVAVASGISPSSDEHSRLFFVVVVVFGDSFSRFLFVSAAFVFVFNLFFFLFVVVVVFATASTHARDARTVVPSIVLLAVVVSSIVVAPSRFFGRVAFTILLFVAAVDVASVERSRVVPILGVDDDVFVPIVHATTRASTSFATDRRRLSSRASSSHRSSSLIRRRAPFSRSPSSS